MRFWKVEPVKLPQPQSASLIVESLERRRLLSAIDVELVALLSQSSSDELATLPTSISQLNPGDTFYVESWIKTVDGSTVEILGGYIDFSYDASIVSGTTIDHGGIYTNLTDGDIDNGTGLIDDLGGAAGFGSSGMGVDQWARLGIVTFTADQQGTVVFTAAAGIAKFYRGANIEWADVEFNTPLLSLGVGGAPSGVGLSIDDVIIVETDQGTTEAVFDVSLSAATSNTVTVDFYTTDDTATTADSDYQSSAGTLTFPADTTDPQTITVTINGDVAVEDDETFFVNLTNPANATIDDNQATGTIVVCGSGQTLVVADGGKGRVGQVNKEGFIGLGLGVAID